MRSVLVMTLAVLVGTARAQTATSADSPLSPEVRARLAEKARSIRVEGKGLSSEQVLVAVLAYMDNWSRTQGHTPSPLTRCFLRGPEDPIVGPVVVRFSILPDGNVAQPVIERVATASAAAQACVMLAVRAVTFPRPSDGRSVVVAYPFNFELPGKLWVNGFGLPPAKIAEVIGKSLPAMDACFYRAKAEEPGLKGGHLRWRFTIDAQGHPASPVARRSGFTSEAAEACMIEIVRGMRFSPPTERGGVEVSFPLSYGTQGRAL